MHAVILGPFIRPRISPAGGLWARVVGWVAWNRDRGLAGPCGRCKGMLDGLVGWRAMDGKRNHPDRSKDRPGWLQGASLGSGEPIHSGFLFIDV